MSHCRAEPENRPVSLAPPDEDLMSAYARGHLASFETLYARHRAGLYRFVRRLLGPAAGTQADEVYQDTWLRVIQSRERWAPQGASFRTWLYTLAHHRAVDCLRRSGRECPLDDGGDGEAPPWEPADAPWAEWPAADGAQEDRLFWRAAGRRLLDCLEHLPAAQKTAFLLHHEDGMALDELAALLGLGFETAKSRLRYAMTKLRRCMGAYLAPGAAPESGAP